MSIVKNSKFNVYKLLLNVNPIRFFVGLGFRINTFEYNNKLYLAF